MKKRKKIKKDYEILTTLAYVEKFLKDDAKESLIKLTVDLYHSEYVRDVLYKFIDDLAKQLKTHLEIED